ncbi:DUF3800 domain-containing protein [Pedobacter panaciterrae]
MEELNHEISEETGNPEQKPTLSKEEKAAIESKALQNRVISGQIVSLKDKVAFILNNNPDARNSDIKLSYLFWHTFESEKLGGETSITVEKMLALTKFISLSRMRAKIQYEYKLYQADPKVRKSRGKLEEGFKQEAIEDKPEGLPLYQVFIDETGKTQDYLSVGSLWQLGYSPGFILKVMDFEKWKNDKGIDYEFHFSHLTKHKVDVYKEFFSRFVSSFPDIGFKLIILNNRDLTNKNDAIRDLTFHLIKKGIEHEHESGRASLPRMLQVWIDDEESGSDQLKLENVKERLSVQKIKGLHLDKFQAISSKDNIFIQAVDLFSGAVNRKVNPSGGNNFKDEFADFVLTLLNFDIKEVDKDNTQIDSSKLFNLSGYVSE